MRLDYFEQGKLLFMQNTAVILYWAKKVIIVFIFTSIKLKRNIKYLNLEIKKYHRFVITNSKIQFLNIDVYNNNLNLG